jgi:hypothetical protein
MGIRLWITRSRWPHVLRLTTAVMARARWHVSALFRKTCSRRSSSLELAKLITVQAYRDVSTFLSDLSLSMVITCKIRYSAAGTSSPVCASYDLESMFSEVKHFQVYNRDVVNTMPAPAYFISDGELSATTQSLKWQHRRWYEPHRVCYLV